MLTIVKFTESAGLYGAGELAGFPPDKAALYIEKGVAIEVDEDGNPITSVETEPTLDSMTKDELVALAEERGLEVAREDGEDGEPLKDDYVRALTE